MRGNNVDQKQKLEEQTNDNVSVWETVQRLCAAYEKKTESVVTKEEKEEKKQKSGHEKNGWFIDSFMKCCASSRK